jgi:hypothetical protein
MGLITTRDSTVGIVSGDNIDASDLDTIHTPALKEGKIESSPSDCKRGVECYKLSEDSNWGWEKEKVLNALKDFWKFYFGKKMSKPEEFLKSIPCAYTRKSEAFPLLLNIDGDLWLLIAPRISY